MNIRKVLVWEKGGLGIMNQDSPMYSFLKSRRPNEFSDSIIKKQGKLTKEFLDYFLNSLTSRSQEKEFEIFCRRLAEKEICPNLLPQTGPTGGGDSKVDSETYPVSESIAFSWYIGNGKAAANERWAFAISAKKAWRPKCISDIDKIIATERDYKEIFFITNQYVSDKKRSILEDELTNKFKIRIHILDRTWILEKVFTNNHENIVIDTLHLSIDFKTEKDLGPFDYRRKKESEKAEKEIMNYIISENFNLHLIEKSIEVALLSKEMELPFYETKGKFERAINLAKEYGTKIQLKEASYQWAWGAYWWYNNKTEFENTYTNYESLVIGSNNFFDIERLTNLWMNLYTLYKRDLNNPVLKLKTDILLKEYDRLASDFSRLNTSLEARANLIFVKLFLQEDISQLFEELGTIIEEAKYSLDFSFKTIEKMISGLSDFFLENSKYDMLFEELIKISENRSKEINGAKLLLARGRSFYPTKPYTTIRYLGRSLIKLYKSESKNLLIEALYYMGVSFSKIGLYWASYGYFANAFFIAFIDYMKFGNVSTLLIGCADNLRKIELQCGLIANSLEWNNLYNISKELVQSAGINIVNPVIKETDQIYDGLLGMFFLNLEYNEFSKLIKLPDNLERMNLTMSALALKYVLGYVDKELSSIYKDEDQLEDFISKWSNQPAKENLSNIVICGMEEKVCLESKILGCLIKLNSSLIFPCVELSKSIFASVEAFMATSILDKIIARYSEVYIKVVLAKTKYKTSYTVEEKKGSLYYYIYCNSYEQSEFVSSQNQIKEFLFKFITEFVARAFIFNHYKSQIKKMVLEEEVFSRALEFSNCIFPLDDFMGREAFSLKKWIIADSKSYIPLKRGASYKDESPLEDSKVKKAKINDIHYGVPEQFQPEDINYNDIVMDKLINIPLWDQAKWKGMTFLIYPEPKGPTILAPIFSDKTSCIAIFKKWISDFGNFDSENKIRCCLIKGVDKDNPEFYRFAFSPNINILHSTKNQFHFINLSRFQLMQSKDNRPLNSFLDKTKINNNYYFLAPAIMKSEIDKVEILYDYAIKKCHLEVKNAWEIGRNDWWAFTILPDDKPIIPPMVLKAPVTELLELKRN